MLCLSKKYLSNTFTNICYESRNCKLSQLNKVVSSSVWYLYTFKKKNSKLLANDYGKSEVLYLFGLNHILGSLKTNFLVVKWIDKLFSRRGKEHHHTKSLNWWRVSIHVLVSIGANAFEFSNKDIQIIHGKKNGNQFNTIFERLLHFTTCLLVAVVVYVCFSFRFTSKPLEIMM